jgi:hypothetical protein
VRDLGLNRASDETIWEWAKGNSYTIVTTDSDFVGLSAGRGWPPKVVHLEECDVPLRIVEDLLRHRTRSEFRSSPKIPGRAFWQSASRQARDSGRGCRRPELLTGSQPLVHNRSWPLCGVGRARTGGRTPFLRVRRRKQEGMPDFGPDFGQTLTRTPEAIPGTNCPALRYETKSPRPAPGAHTQTAGSAYRLTWTLVPPPGPPRSAPLPLETTLTQSASLSL